MVRNFRFISYQSGFDAGDTIRSAQLIRDGDESEVYYRIDGNVGLLGSHVRLYYYACIGDCIIPAAKDVCGLYSVPLRCQERDLTTPSTACLCNLGYRSSSNGTCLGI